VRKPDDCLLEFAALSRAAATVQRLRFYKEASRGLCDPDLVPWLLRCEILKPLRGCARLCQPLQGYPEGGGQFIGYFNQL